MTWEQVRLVALIIAMLCIIWYHFYCLKNVCYCYSPPKAFFKFFNWANGTKSRNSSQFIPVKLWIQYSHTWARLLSRIPVEINVIESIVNDGGKRLYQKENTVVSWENLGIYTIIEICEGVLWPTFVKVIQGLWKFRKSIMRKKYRVRDKPWRLVCTKRLYIPKYLNKTKKFQLQICLKRYCTPAKTFYFMKFYFVKWNTIQKKAAG